MTIPLHKAGASAALFALILLGAVLLVPRGGGGASPPLAVFMPYLLAVGGAALAVVFRQAREFNQFLLLVLAYFGLGAYAWSPGTGQEGQLLLEGLLALLVPLNFILAVALRERGVLNHHGLLRVILLAVQASAAMLLLQLRPPALAAALHARWFDLPATGWFDLPHPGLAAAVAALAFLVARALLAPSVLANGRIFALLAALAAVAQMGDPVAARLWLAIAAFILLAASVLNAYSLAYLDELTGLPSRRALKQDLQRLGRRYTLAMLDVDYFKRINDTYGHDVGDQVLRMVAAQIRRTPGVRAYRYGGEEFALVFTGRDADETQVQLEALRQRINETPFHLRRRLRPRRRPENPRPRGNPRTVFVSASIGLAQRAAHHVDAFDVLKAADRALYRAKRSGRNQVVRA